MNTAQLDSHLLSTPFSIQTNWHVLTGAACTGKTTLINMLVEKGFQIFPEHLPPCPLGGFFRVYNLYNAIPGHLMWE